MVGYPNKQQVEAIRRKYPEGTRVDLISMDDPYSKLRPVERGNVEHVDDIGTVFVRWDCGSGLGVVYGVDEIRIVEDAQQNAQHKEEHGHG